MVLRVTPTYCTLEGRIPLSTWNTCIAALQYSRQVYGYVRGRGKIWQSVPVQLHAQVPHGLAFPSGLLHRIRPLLPPDTPVIPFTEPATLPPVVTQLRDGHVLYPDQVTAVQVGLQQRRGLLALATNFGKTDLLASLLATVRDAPALVLLNQKGLVVQTAGALAAKTGETINVWGGGRRSRTNARITVATIQTLHLKRHDPAVQQWLGQIQLLLVDEGDVISPPSWFPTLGLCTGAWLRLAMSGTMREVKHPLAVEAFFGPVLHEVADPELVDAGRSAQTTVLMPLVGQQVQDGTDYGGEQGVYERGIIRHLARNQLLADFAALAAKLALPTLVSFYRLEHGEFLERLCRERYLGPVVRLDGRSADYEVAHVQKTAGAGEPGIYLTGVGYNRGLDMPGLRVLVNAAAWKSPQATSQRSGRVIRRKATGGNWALIVDPFDLGNSTLKRHAQARERVYRRKGFHVLRGRPEDLQATLRDLAAAPTAPG